MPSLRVGYCLVVSAVLFFVLGSYATLLSAFYPLSGVPVSGCRGLSPVRSLERRGHRRSWTCSRGTRTTSTSSSS